MRGELGRKMANARSTSKGGQDAERMGETVRREQPGPRANAPRDQAGREKAEMSRGKGGMKSWVA